MQDWKILHYVQNDKEERAMTGGNEEDNEEKQ